MIAVIPAGSVRPPASGGYAAIPAGPPFVRLFWDA
jgi:hypothetical protein